MRTHYQQTKPTSTFEVIATLSVIAGIAAMIVFSI